MQQDKEVVALVHAVVANPDDDVPRLAYADWLENHGQIPRARLIRVQCQIEALQAEGRDLIDRYGKEWGSELFAAGADHWRFHRGFPEEVTMRISDFLTEHQNLNKFTPLTQLHLVGGVTDDRVRQLAQLPAARQIRSLEFNWPSNTPDAGTYGNQGIRSLAASPYLQGLRQLKLHSHQIGTEGLKIIAQAPTFANLTHLIITDPGLQKIDGTQVVELLKSPHFAKLQELQLGDSKFGEYFRRLLKKSPDDRTGERGAGG